MCIRRVPMSHDVVYTCVFLQSHYFKRYLFLCARNIFLRQRIQHLNIYDQVNPAKNILKNLRRCCENWMFFNALYN